MERVSTQQEEPDGDRSYTLIDSKEHKKTPKHREGARQMYGDRDRTIRN